ncbi:MAG TPA: aspartate/glutamate racemase family protein [Hyphomicrobiaceae bacterium]|nr:aspartate/glutamate racemase family protein [Hyphomicrobiaceae bacterium]
MIGVFDSGHGGLTVFRALVRRFPHVAFAYLGDHRNVPYGNRPSDEIVTLTRDGVEALFRRGCRLVLLGCNTATCVAARTLQKDWLPVSGWAGRNILGIVAPTVEAATQTPWAVTAPQYPQKYNTDVVAVFGTTRTIASHAYPEEIRKRCPKVTVVQQTCAELAGAIERGAPEHELDAIVEQSVTALLAQTGGEPPHRAILGCTHYPLVEPLFRRHLPPFTRLLSQPEVVADSLEDYLQRHPRYLDGSPDALRSAVLLTTGDPAQVARVAKVFWPEAPAFTHLPH